jgi:tetratricopeptide (TPR) repeat protein
MLKNKNLIKYLLCLSIMLFVGNTASAECNAESIIQYERFLEEGRNLHKKGALKAAIDRYSDAIKVYSNNWKAYNLRGEANTNLGNYKEALSDFTIMEGLIDSPKFIIYKGKAGVMNGLGDWSQSIEYADKALDSFYTATENEKAEVEEIWVADLYALQGFNYYVIGNNKEALINFSKAVELRPTEWMYLGCKARTLARMGFINDAIKAYNEAIDIAPDQLSLQEEKHALIKRRSEK